MALLTFEGFEAYDNTAQAAQSLNTSVGGSAAISTAQARTGARSFTTGPASTGNFFRRVFTRTNTTVIVGAAFRFSSVTPNTAYRLIHFGDTVNGIGQTGFGLNTNGNLVVGRGVAVNNTSFFTVLATNGAETEPTNTWVYYELKVLLDHTANGSFTLRRNGQVVLSGSNVITTSGSNIDVNAVTLRTDVSTNYCDDLYVCDGAGSLNNDFLGQVRVAALRPDANFAVGWTPNTGANWDAVNDTTPDDDATYVEAATTGLEDLYDVTNLPADTVAVRGVMVQYRGRLNTAGAAELRTLLRSGSTTVQGALDAQDVGYRYYSTLHETDPATSAAWTPAAVDAVKAGVRRET